MITQEQFYTDILPVTLEHEGGYANVVGDKGGETYCGISRVNNPKWQGWAIIDAKKKLFSNGKIPWNKKFPELLPLVMPYYWDNYFVNAGFNKLNHVGLALNLFDNKVLGGYSVYMLNSILREKFSIVSNETILNDKLAALINSVDGALFAAEVIERRRQRYTRLAQNVQYSKFYDGWISRLRSLAQNIKVSPTTAKALGIGGVLLLVGIVVAGVVIYNKMQNPIHIQA